jgi:hypothetical protein
MIKKICILALIVAVCMCSEINPSKENPEGNEDKLPRKLQEPGNGQEGLSNDVQDEKEGGKQNAENELAKEMMKVLQSMREAMEMPPSNLQGPGNDQGGLSGDVQDEEEGGKPNAEDELVKKMPRSEEIMKIGKSIKSLSYYPNNLSGVFNSGKELKDTMGNNKISEEDFGKLRKLGGEILKQPKEVSRDRPQEEDAKPQATLSMFKALLRRGPN